MHDSHQTGQEPAPGLFGKAWEVKLLPRLHHTEEQQFSGGQRSWGHPGQRSTMSVVTVGWKHMPFLVGSWSWSPIFLSAAAACWQSLPQSPGLFWISSSYLSFLPDNTPTHPVKWVSPGPHCPCHSSATILLHNPCVFLLSHQTASPSRAVTVLTFLHSQHPVGAWLLRAQKVLGELKSNTLPGRLSRGVGPLTLWLSSLNCTPAKEVSGRFTYRVWSQLM